MNKKEIEEFELTSFPEPGEDMKDRLYGMHCSLSDIACLLKMIAVELADLKER